MVVECGGLAVCSWLGHFGILVVFKTLVSKVNDKRIKLNDSFEYFESLFCPKFVWESMIHNSAKLRDAGGVDRL